MEKGYVALVLHAHLPFVRHPEHEHFLEENWLYEAITETYIPLINVFDGLISDGIDFRITLSLTPPLIAMLTDSLLQDRYLRHIDRLIELAEKEVDRTRWQPEFHQLALMYHFRFTTARDVFLNRYKKDLLDAFRRFQELGKVEIITSGATHGYLPLMSLNRSAVAAQVAVGVAQYRRIFGRQPRGIWLPECGYEPGIDELLKEAGLRFFITDAHGILHASPRPKFGVFAPIYCPSGMAAFGRDLESSKQVWSAEEGYPGDYDYRDFYRDIGFDLDYEYVRPYIHQDGMRLLTGIKYYRITGKTDEKQPYRPLQAQEKAAIHAGNFMFNRERQVEHLLGIMDRTPIVVAPYDAELFGHWWYEGPDWLNFLLRKMAHDQSTLRLVTLSEYLEENPVNQVSTPSMSSWGYKGYHEVWLNGANDWIYRHLHKAADRMTELADAYRDNEDELRERGLKQAARELLLAQSSDWAFIMKTGTVVEYAARRTNEHLLRFTHLYRQITDGEIDEGWLHDIEGKDNIFPDIDFRVYCDR